MQPRTRQIPLFPERSAAKARRGPNALQPHIARPAHHRDHPVHVSMRRVPVGPSFRTQRVCAAIRGVIAEARRNGVRVVHYSVQDNHLHLLVEGRHSADLSNQMRTLFSRIAFAVNAIARRHGKLFRDRHHRHELISPREVRNALVYILFNDRKHRPSSARGSEARSAENPVASPSLDPCSSAWWFRDWAPWDHPPRNLLRDRAEAPTAEPKTWLASFGWRWGLGRNRDGRIRFSEAPRSALRRPATRPAAARRRPAASA
jgi:putative transposase